jgi:hypothetical protein
MTNPSAPNPFGEFEADFQKTEKAAPGSMPGRVPPATYKFTCTAVDKLGDGVLVDYDIFAGKQKGTKGFKLFCEILEPKAVMSPITKQPQETAGVIIEHVFWVTTANLPYIMRDISTILGRDLASMGEVVNTIWAGRTFEGIVKDEEYPPGTMRSRIGFINAWNPPAAPGPNPHGPIGGSGGPQKKSPEDPKKTPDKPAEKPKDQKKPEGDKAPDVDF